MVKISFISIFKVFFKIGVILLGGGYVIIPIMKSELIEKRNWLNDDELCDYYCIAQCLPGIIAINMAILVGYKLLKIKGMIASVVAMSLSPFVSIIIAAKLLSTIVKIPFIEGIFWGVNLSVIVLIYLTLAEMWKKSIVDLTTLVWFLLILFLSLIRLSPVLLILVSIALGVIIQIIKDRKNA